MNHVEASENRCHHGPHHQVESNRRRAMRYCLQDSSRLVMITHLR